MPRELGQCPKCDVLMDTMRMLGVDFENCPSCNGVWLDHGELETLTRSRGGQALHVELKSNKRTKFMCPKCRPAAVLFECVHNLDEGFTLDVCGTCQGIWFDRGEFPSLLQNRKHP